MDLSVLIPARNEIFLLNTIKDLLLKFGNILLKEEVKKDLIRETISKAINFQIKKEDIKMYELSFVCEMAVGGSQGIAITLCEKCINKLTYELTKLEFDKEVE